MLGRAIRQPSGADPPKSATSISAPCSLSHVAHNRTRPARCSVTESHPIPAPQVACPGVDLTVTRQYCFLNHAQFLASMFRMGKLNLVIDAEGWLIVGLKGHHLLSGGGMVAGAGHLVAGATGKISEIHLNFAQELQAEDPNLDMVVEAAAW